MCSSQSNYLYAFGCLSYQRIMQFSNWCLSYPIRSPTGYACNDYNYCTLNDACDATGACVGTQKDCGPAPNQCQGPGVCDQSSGNVLSDLNGIPCDDGDACSQTDICYGGICVGSNYVQCFALDQCHIAGICDPSSGTCSNPTRSNNTPCNDGNACTKTDLCVSGMCQGSNLVTCSALDQCHIH